jgi:hypothetical protein
MSINRPERQYRSSILYHSDAAYRAGQYFEEAYQTKFSSICDDYWVLMDFNRNKIPYKAPDTAAKTWMQKLRIKLCAKLGIETIEDKLAIEDTLRKDLGIFKTKKRDAERSYCGVGALYDYLVNVRDYMKAGVVVLYVKAMSATGGPKVCILDQMYDCEREIVRLEDDLDSVGYLKYCAERTVLLINYRISITQNALDRRVRERMKRNGQF